MFSNLRERLRSEDGTIANVFMLAACILFVTGFAAAFALGKYAQADQMSQRCASMVAKSTMVYMQRQAPPNKGVLTQEAKNEGIFMFNRGLCNSDFGGNPLMKDTATINFAMGGTDTLVVTISQYVKGYALARYFPWKMTTTAAAYTYQYGGQGKSPIYDGSQVPKVNASVAPVLLTSPTEATPTPAPTNAAGSSNPSPSPTTEAGGGVGTSTSPTPTPSPSQTVQPTYTEPYPEAAEGLICHATNNANKFPYQQIGPAPAGIISGHMGQIGPIFSTSMKSGSQWGDIIPPMPAIGIEGLNWTPTGQAIWHNACDYWTAPLP